MAKEATKTTRAEDAPIWRPRIRVTAPAGPRRRAGLSFGKTPRDLAMEELGETAEEQEAAFKLLLADPMLSVAPIGDVAGED